jgi:hypothetical protein
MPALPLAFRVTCGPAPHSVSARQSACLQLVLLPRAMARHSRCLSTRRNCAAIAAPAPRGRSANLSSSILQSFRCADRVWVNLCERIPDGDPQY